MELIMVMKSTNLYEGMKVFDCYRWSWDRSLVLIRSGADRDVVVIWRHYLLCIGIRPTVS